jgi:hypothetical protein
MEVSPELSKARLDNSREQIFITFYPLGVKNSNLYYTRVFNSLCEARAWMLRQGNASADETETAEWKLFYSGKHYIGGGFGSGFGGKV